MPSAMLAAMARGGVVAVVDEEAAERALSLGVDEVLRPIDAVSADAIRAAVERARLRAAARAERDARLAEELCRSDGEALELLGAAAAHDLQTPLAVASLDCEMVTEALGVVVGVADEVARWAVSTVPPPLDELRRLAAARRSVPPTDELAATTNDLAAALRRATQVVRKMSALAATEEPAERVCLVESLLKVESLMRGSSSETRPSRSSSRPARATWRSRGGRCCSRSRRCSATRRRPSPRAAARDASSSSCCSNLTRPSSRSPTTAWG